MSEEPKDDKTPEDDARPDEEREGEAHERAELDEGAELDDDAGAAIRALLKRSLAPEDHAVEEEPPRELLASVQRKIRERSRGKFYADGWSTTPSRLNYVLVAAIMLLIVVVVYVALGPTGISP